KLQGSFSSDGLMLGLQFFAENHDWHFRLTSCRASGKGPFFSEKLLDREIQALERNARAPSAVRKSEPREKPARPDADVSPADGGVINDQVDHSPAHDSLGR